MLEEMIMKSNESESGCKTKTNKTNVEQNLKTIKIVTFRSMSKQSKKGQSMNKHRHSWS